MSRSRPRPSPWRGPACVGLTLALAGSGCAPFDTGGWTAAGLGTIAERRTLLKPVSEVVAGALELEYVLVERPAGDPLLGDLLWNDLDQIGALRPEVRRSLAEHGLRVGVASANPPDALRKLLGEAAELVDHKTQEDARRLRAHRLTLRPGSATEAQTSDPIDRLTAPVDVGGRTADKTFEQARCVLRVTAESEQEGWATLEFLPEIHHGTPQLRPAAEASGWQLRTGQEVHKLFGQRFALTLNEGEMAVVASLGDDPAKAGHHFFHATADGVPIRRMLVVRVVKADGGKAVKPTP